MKSPNLNIGGKKKEEEKADNNKQSQLQLDDESGRRIQCEVRPPLLYIV